MEQGSGKRKKQGSPERRKMNIRDLSELKRIWKPENLCCDKYAACYLDGEGGMNIQEAKPLLAEPEGMIRKHMALAKKLLSGEPENQILQVPFLVPETEESTGTAREVLERIMSCRLEEEETLEKFFRLMTEPCHREEPYELLLYHLSYDIPVKGTDGADQGESDEVYEHVLCLLCQVKMTKENLGVEDGLLSMTRRDRVIGAPVLGLIWPAFDNRSGDRDAMILYHADPGEVPHGFWLEAFDLQEFLTTAEIRRQMAKICQVVIQDPKKMEACLAEIGEALGNREPESIVTVGDFKRILEEAQIPEPLQYDLLRRYDASLCRYSPKAYQLQDPERSLETAKGKQRKKMRELLLQAAGFIRDVNGQESELVRRLLTAADLQG